MTAALAPAVPTAAELPEAAPDAAEALFFVPLPVPRPATHAEAVAHFEQARALYLADAEEQLYLAGMFGRWGMTEQYDVATARIRNDLAEVARIDGLRTAG